MSLLRPFEFSNLVRDCRSSALGPPMTLLTHKWWLISLIESASTFVLSLSWFIPPSAIRHDHHHNAISCLVIRPLGRDCVEPAVTVAALVLPAAQLGVVRAGHRGAVPAEEHHAREAVAVEGRVLRVAALHAEADGELALGAGGPGALHQGDVGWSNHLQEVQICGEGKWFLLDWWMWGLSSGFRPIACSLYGLACKK